MKNVFSKQTDFIPPIKYPPSSSDFFFVLRKRVYQYFEKNKSTRYATPAMYAQTALMFAIWAITYGLILSNLFKGWNIVWLQMVFHFFSFSIWVQVAHDAHHRAFTKNKSVNKIILFIGDMMGVSSYVMDYNHVKAHHSAVNVPHHDVSIDSFGVMRFHPAIKRKWFHRYQAFYIWILYGIATVFKLFIFDFFTLMRKSIGAHQIEKHPLKEIVYLTFTKSICIFYSLVLPCLLLDCPNYIIISGFFIGHFVSGIGLSLIFQVTHLCDYSLFTNVNKKENRMDNSFAVHVLENTSSFSTNSWFITWIGGGLNCHTIHHLFPEICQIHFRPLSKILKQTCVEYGVPYKEYPSTWSALKSHISLLNKLGKKEPYQPQPFTDWKLSDYKNEKEKEGNAAKAKQLVTPESKIMQEAVA